MYRGVQLSEGKLNIAYFNEWVVSKFEKCMVVEEECMEVEEEVVLY